MELLKNLEIRSPVFPESIEEGTLSAWHRKPGEPVRRDELLAEVETDKVVLEVMAPADGTLEQVLVGEGETLGSGVVIGLLERGTVAPLPPLSGEKSAGKEAPVPTFAPMSGSEPIPREILLRISPAARRLLKENDLDPRGVQGTGKNGRITKGDVLAYLNSLAADPGTPSSEVSPAPPAPVEPSPAPAGLPGERPEQRVPMTRLRRTIARRLLEAQQGTATLSTFNEVDMHRVMTLRARHREAFAERHGGVRLGFMSFFVKAATVALQRFPEVNASVDGDDIVYHGYQDIGVAISSERGLVVPVLRDAGAMGLAEIEAAIADFSARAAKSKLQLEEMRGGTFTISNGGVFGSLLSTPILNPPQTAILGMHRIQERPVALDGQVVVRPMMYLALSYDHRLIDGSGAVRFLIAIKELVEEPVKLLFE